nr:PqqD family peptide modification chaperone [Pseudomaricurvus sp. HS19]
MRGRTWYVLQDAQSGKYFRVSPAVRDIIQRLDGRASIDDIWQAAAARLGKEQPTQSEVIELIAQLYRADLIRGDVPPDMDELVHRAGTQARQRFLSRYKNPLALRFPLLDPDRFLNRIMPVFRPLFTYWGALLLVVLGITGVVLAVLNFTALTSNLSDRVLSRDNLILMLLLYPVIKGLHEMGHAIAAKAFGGEVHEIGIMLLVFMPVPYVDASAASAFRSRWQRAAVGAAGIAVEFLLAVLALLVWLQAEPGLVRAAAFNVIIIGGVSTLLFNGNPLLRFDGYYVLSDLLAIPNLASRSNRYLMYLIKTRLFSLPNQENPAHSRGEQRWFIFYGIASFVYRLFITITIALFIATRFFFIGVLLACFSLYMALLKPTFNALRYLLFAPSLGQQRARVQMISATLLVTLLAALFYLPAPYSTRTEGVLSMGQQAQVVAGASGFVARVVQESGSEVQAGDDLIVLEDLELASTLELLEAQLQEFTASYRGVNLFDKVQADILNQQIARTRARLDYFRQRQQQLSLTAASTGQLVIPAVDELPGRFLEEGTVAAYVLPAAVREVDVVVGSDRVSLVSDGTLQVEVRVEGAVDRVIPARIIRQTPSSLERLPSHVLTARGGGTIAVDPEAASTLAPLGSYYLFTLALDEPVEQRLVEGRVYVRFVHQALPLGRQWLLVIRQTFLRLLNV